MRIASGVLTAWHIPALPPIQPLPSIQIRLASGTLLAELVTLYGPPGLRGWDVGVARAGFTRISRWATTDLGHVCKVVRSAVLSATGTAAAARATGTLASCTASTHLSSDQAAQLDGHEFGARRGDLVACELQAGHRSMHVGLGQESDDGRWWWLHWLTSTSRLVRLSNLCEIEGRPPPYSSRVALLPCCLPSDHQGGHSWQLSGFFAV